VRQRAAGITPATPLRGQTRRGRLLPWGLGLGQSPIGATHFKSNCQNRRLLKRSNPISRMHWTASRALLSFLRQQILMLGRKSVSRCRSVPHSNCARSPHNFDSRRRLHPSEGGAFAALDRPRCSECSQKIPPKFSCSFVAGKACLSLDRKQRESMGGTSGGSKAEGPLSSN
jgi:hypothetical protein